MKATPKIGKVSAINLVDDTSELMVISQFGKIIRIDTKSIRAAGRGTQGVKLLDLEDQDKVAAAVVIPQKKPKPNPKRERCCNNRSHVRCSEVYNHKRAQCTVAIWTSSTLRNFCRRSFNPRRTAVRTDVNLKTPSRKHRGHVAEDVMCERKGIDASFGHTPDGQHLRLETTHADGLLSSVWRVCCCCLSGIPLIQLSSLNPSGVGTPDRN